MDLRECPFCRSRVLYRQAVAGSDGSGHQIKCGSCYACGPMEKSREQVAVAWDKAKRNLEAMNISDLAESLKHINLEPWHDGRSILDGKRPVEQHIMMVINSLKAERDSWIEKFHKASDQAKEPAAMTPDEIRHLLLQIVNFQMQMVMLMNSISPISGETYKIQRDLIDRMERLNEIIIGKAS